jgi:hypothetical protein
MNTGRTVFSQLMDYLLDENNIDAAVGQYGLLEFVS